MAPTPLLFCSHVVDWGGAERVLADLLQEIDRSRFAPHLACPGPGPLAVRASELGVPVHAVPVGGRSRLAKAISLPRAARSLRALASDIGARVVVATSMIAGYAAVLAQHRELRCVWHLHVVTRSRIASAALRRAAIVIAPSRAGALAAAPDLAHSGRLVVLPNGVPDPFFAARGSGLRASLGVVDGATLFGIVGRIDPDKGHEVLLRAFAELPATTAGPHLIVVGGEAFANSRQGVMGLTERLRSRALELGIAQRVHFLGHRDDTAALLGQIDVLVAPSTAPESAPRTIAEGQAAGLAVVASSIGGIPELIEDGVTGVLVPPNDPAALQERLRQLHADGRLRADLGARARRHAETAYSMRVFAQRFTELCAATGSARA